MGFGSYKNRNRIPSNTKIINSKETIGPLALCGKILN